MKKLASLLLALVMTLALSVSALAAGETGSITINKAVKDQTYTIYRIFNLNDHNTDYSAINYKVNTKWAGFFAEGAAGLDYVTIDDMGYVTWKDNKKDAASLQAFADAALKYAKDNNVENDGTKTAADSEVKFENLELGYYLVHSALGSLCTLDTNMPNVTIEEKNQEPTNEKKVEEDSTGTLGSENDADIGQMVKFVSEVTLPAGSENVTFHDKMSDGLTMVIGEEGKTGLTVYSDAELENIIPDGNWPQIVPGTDGCTFDVDLSSCISAYDKVYVVYYATVNENAKVGSEGNPNESWLSYGETGTTTTVPSKTTTYTWKIDVFKYTMVKGENGAADTEKALAGAEFILYKDVKNGESTTRYYAKATTVEGGYRFTEWTTDKAAATTFVTPDNGKFAIKGLDSDTYYQEETKAPAGYNVLKAPVKVVIDNEGKVTYGNDNTAAAPDVKVLNQTGTELPSTGGIGTTIFYVLGSVLVVAAGVLLVTKKRMDGKA